MVVTLTAKKGRGLGIPTVAVRTALGVTSPPFFPGDFMTHSGGKPHTNVGDRGQRFEVTYLEDGGERKVMGWAERQEDVDRMFRAINLHPCWREPRVMDRREPTTEQLEAYEPLARMLSR